MAVVKGHQPDTGGTYTGACGQVQNKVTAIWPEANGNGLGLVAGCPLRLFYRRSDSTFIRTDHRYRPIND